MKTLIIIILLILILFFYNFENFAIHDILPSKGRSRACAVPTISYVCPDNSILKDDNMCYEINVAKCDNNNCYLDNNITELKCQEHYSLQNNICYSNLDNSFEKPYCDDGYNIVNNKCVQLNGLPTCLDGNIPYNGICKSDPFMPKTIFTCPDNSINEYGGVCNGNIYNPGNNSTTKEIVSVVY
jgi:hypothetical protein